MRMRVCCVLVCAYGGISVCVCVRSSPNSKCELQLKSAATANKGDRHKVLLIKND